jgi:hypothetical protein
VRASSDVTWLCLFLGWERTIRKGQQRQVKAKVGLFVGWFCVTVMVGCV